MTLRLVTGDDRPGPPARPHPHECVACFVERMTRAYGCSNELTWAVRWRDHCAPRATALERRLRAKGGFCDCEILMNVYVRPEWLPDPWIGADEPSPGGAAGDEVEAPACLGVRQGSTRTCPHWVAY